MKKCIKQKTRKFRCSVQVEEYFSHFDFIVHYE